MRKLLVDPLISLYGWLNRHKAFDVPVLWSFFVHSYFFYKRHFEDPFSQLVSMRPELFTHGHLLDVGANIGYTSVVFASALKPGQKVFAFEPERSNFDRLVGNVTRFGVADRVVAHCVAVGAHDGSVNLWLNERHLGDHRTVTRAFYDRIQSGKSIREVPLVSMDSFLESNHLLKQIGFIKIDVQGYETEVCRGMERTLRANPRVVVAIEYAPGSMAELGFRAETLLEFFVERDFYVYELKRRGKLRPIRDGQVQIDSDGWTNLLCSRAQL